MKLIQELSRFNNTTVQRAYAANNTTTATYLQSRRKGECLDQRSLIADIERSSCPRLLRFSLADGGLNTKYA